MTTRPPAVVGIFTGLLVVISGLLSGCSINRSQPAALSTTSSPAHAVPEPTANGSGASNVIKTPAHRLFLGIFVNSAGANGTADGGMKTYEQRAQFDASIDRHIAIDLHYSKWTSPLASPSVLDDLNNDTIPLISWECGDTDASVASGHDDQLLTHEAKSIAALHKPVMIRWFWEMEFTGSNGGQQGARAAQCIGTGGPSGYVAAWRHIVDVFRANGATNVDWVFCPGQDAYAAGAVDKGRAASQFYPGNSYVDWIAEDAYSREIPTPLPSLVQGMYSEYGNSGKPLMVCETGAEGSYQPAFLHSAEALPSEDPNLKALVYFDSHGPRGSYVLTSSGRAAFAQLAASPAFSSQPTEG